MFRISTNSGFSSLCFHGWCAVPKPGTRVPVQRDWQFGLFLFLVPSVPSWCCSLCASDGGLRTRPCPQRVRAGGSGHPRPVGVLGTEPSLSVWL